MSETKSNSLEAMLAQYDTNNKPKYVKSDTAKTYDLKNYFNTFIKEGTKSAVKTIRILPTQDGSTPFVEVYGHKAQVEGAWKTFACLKHERNEACPFCEARELLLATGEESKKEMAKKYNARLMYVVKVIDREKEEEGVKVWRFNHDYRKEGILDKIQGVLLAIKKDVTNPTTGRDLCININRNTTGAPVVSSVSHMDPSPLSENAEQSAVWLSDVRTWEDVYSVKSYEYLAIIVTGGTPVWDKEEKKYVDKDAVKEDTGDKLDAELTIGVNSVKNTVQAVTTSSESTTEEDDDLPF